MTNILELMQRHAGRSLGPIQQHRVMMNEQFMIVENSSPGFKDDTGQSLANFSSDLLVTD